MSVSRQIPTPAPSPVPEYNRAFLTIGLCGVLSTGAKLCSRTNALLMLAAVMERRMYITRYVGEAHNSAKVSENRHDNGMREIRRAAYGLVRRSPHKTTFISYSISRSQCSAGLQCHRRFECISAQLPPESRGRQSRALGHEQDNWRLSCAIIYIREPT
jgi:hypothetical protein